MPLLSLVTTYRDRDIKYVENFLKSLANQSEKNFELVFIDYGSKETFKNKAEQLTKKFQFCNYYFIPTEGWFWSRTHALNIGIKKAIGNIIVLADSDLIYVNDFTKVIADSVKKGFFYNYRTRYLTPKIQEFESFFRKESNLNNKYQVSTDYGKGLLVAYKEDIINVNGHNELIKRWGGDFDIYNKLLSSGLKHQWLDENQATTFHQWHSKTYEKSNHSLPPDWQNYWNFKINVLDIKVVDWGNYPDSEKRDCFFAYHGLKTYNIRDFNFHKPLFDNSFRLQSEFESLDRDLLRIKCKKSDIENSCTIAGKVFSTINKFFALIDINYKFLDINIHQKIEFTYSDVNAIIHYFVINNYDKIDDYYYQYCNDEIVFIIKKKV